MSKKQRTGETSAMEISGLAESPVVHDGAIVHGYLGQARASSSATAERGDVEAASQEVPTQEVSREAQGGAATFPAMPSSATVESELRAEVERLHVEVARVLKRVAGFRARRRR